MPDFGPYQTLGGEPLKRREEAGHSTEVWIAKRSDGADAREYAIKVYLPARSRSAKPATEHELEADPCLDFLEGVKRLKKAQQEGERCLAKVYEFGRTDGGAWFATDYCSRGSLEDFIVRKLSPGSAGLRHVAASLVTGCLALKRSSGRSHGGLKASNVLLASEGPALPKTTLELTDPYPASLTTISQLGSEDRREVTEMLEQAIELQDLRCIGEIILQLVEQRQIRSAYDYNYPIQISPSWTGLGKDGQWWLDLCNRLLDPHLSPGTITLESLAAEFGSRGSKLPGLPKLPPKVLIGAGAAVALIVLVSVGVVVMKKAKAGAEAKALQNYQAATNAAATALKSSDFEQAIRQAEIALKIRPEDPFASGVLKDAQAGQTAQQAAAREENYNKALTEARASLAARNYAEAIRQADLALVIRPSDSVASGIKADAERARSALTQAERDYQSATNASGAALRQKDYPEAIRQADLALAVKPADATATSLKQQAQQGQLAMAQAEKEYQAATNAAGVALGQRNYPETIRQADLALAIKPADATATSLKQQAQQAQEAMAQAERNYQSATNAAGVALGQRNYAEALRQADLALVIKPRDPTATTLKEQAQQGQQSMAQAERDYQSATNAAGVAFREKNYPEAMKQADLALAIKPADPAATALKTQAQQAQATMIQAEKDYQSATNAAGVALRDKNYPEVVKQADLALAIKPADPTATSLKAQAQQAQAAVVQAEKDYQSATNAAGVALGQRNYAEAVRQADLALAIKPQDATASALKSQAQQAQTAMAKAEKDYQSATNAAGVAMRNKNYPEVVKQADVALAIKPADPTATSLKAQAQQAQEAVAQAEQSFQSAMKEAQEAYARQDWQSAVTKADEALKHKQGDAAAGKLKADAQTMLDFQQAMDRGGAALASDLALARQQFLSASNAAVKLDPQERTARLQQATAAISYVSVLNELGRGDTTDDFKRRWNAVQSAESQPKLPWPAVGTNVAVALVTNQAGRALASANGTLAEEWLKSGADLLGAQKEWQAWNARLNELKGKADAQFKLATKAFQEDGRYADALNICASYPTDPRFNKLKSEIERENTVFTNAQAQFLNGTKDASHYTTIGQQLNGFSSKAEVSQFLGRVRAEQGEYEQLSKLKTPDTWPQLDSGLKALGSKDPNPSGKLQFKELLAWRDTNDPKWVLLNAAEVLKIVTSVQRDNPRQLQDPILQRPAKDLSAPELLSYSSYYLQLLDNIEPELKSKYPADFEAQRRDLEKVRKSLNRY